jgi:hypothetical protein
MIGTDGDESLGEYNKQNNQSHFYIIIIPVLCRKPSLHKNIFVPED